MIARLGAGFRTIGRLVRQFFCRHDYQKWHVSGIILAGGKRCRDEYDTKHCRKCGKTTARLCKPNKD